MKTLLFFLSLMSIYSINTRSADTVINIKADTLLNVAYGNYAAQQMDIYLPANRSSSLTGSLVLLHGGGWTNGSRHSLSNYIDSFKTRLPGYAIFNVDYRLISSNINFNTQESDIKAAVDFITAYSDTYNISKQKLALVGVSAGAHLALLQAYKNASPQVAAVIDFFGPADLSAMYYNPWNAMIPDLMKSFLGGTPETNTAYKDLSPVNFVTRTTPPTLIFHGRQDYLVSISQSEALQQKLQQAGVVNKLVIYPNAGHGWIGNTLSDSFDKIEDFLKGSGLL